MSSTRGAECTGILDSLSAFLDGDLGAVECEVIEQHCQRCPSCAAIIESMRQTIGLCRDAGQVPLPESVRLRARERVQSLLANTKAASN
jgi:anti-sigma factor RsiW